MAQVVKGLESVVYGIKRKAEGDLRKVQEIVVGAAQIGLNHILPYVPVDKGDLKATGHVEADGRTVTNVDRGFFRRLFDRFMRGSFYTQASIFFGGVAPGGRLVHYAVYVHEDLEKYHAPPTCAKFMEVGIAEAIPEMRRYVRANFVAPKVAVVNVET